MATQDQTVERLFGSALNYKPEDRHAFLDRVCAGAPELRQRVEELLLADEQAGQLSRETNTNLRYRSACRGSISGSKQQLRRHQYLISTQPASSDRDRQSPAVSLSFVSSLEAEWEKFMRSRIANSRESISL